MNGLTRVSRQARIVSLMSAGTLLVGVGLFAYRCEHAPLGDGPLPFWTVFASGFVMVVLPIAATAHLVLGSGRAMVAPVGLVSIAAAVVIAIGEPGNLFGIGYLITLVASVTALLLAAWIGEAIRRWRRR